MKTLSTLSTGINSWATALLILISTSFSACQSEKTNTKIDIHQAVATNNMELVKEYIASGQDLDVKDPFGNSSPLVTAALFDRYAMAELLIESGASIDAINKEGSTALHTAAFFCRTSIVKLLLEKGANQEIVNQYGATPLLSVSGAYKDMESVYKMMEQQLAPLGVQLDLAKIEKDRPSVAAILENAK